LPELSGAGTEKENVAVITKAVFRPFEEQCQQQFIDL
jgi:hypothetical protein